MLIMFETLAPEAAGRAIHQLVLAHMAEHDQRDYAQAFHETLPDLPVGLVQAYAGRGPLDVESVRALLVKLAKALAAQSGETFEVAWWKALDQFPVLAEFVRWSLV